MCNATVTEEFSEVKCAKVIHDIFNKLRGLCCARAGLKQYRYIQASDSNTCSTCSVMLYNETVSPVTVTPVVPVVSCCTMKLSAQ